MEDRERFLYGRKLRIEPPLPGESGKQVPVVRVMADDGQRIIVRSATPGVHLEKVTALVPGDQGVTITPLD